MYPFLGSPFFGFCERAETIREGHVLYWRENLLGVSKSRVFYVFPLNLQGMRLAIGIFQPKTGDSFKLLFRGTAGETPFEIVFQITGGVVSQSQPDSTIIDTPLTSGVIEPGWIFLVNEINSDVVVNSAGNYEVFLISENEETYLGAVTMAHLAIAPYTPEEIIALKSDPLATKFVKMNFTCNACHQGIKAYAGVDKAPSLESQGFRWNLDIKEDGFVCSCGKTKFSLIPIRTGLHGFLRRNLNPQVQTNVSDVRLYEKTALEQHCRDFLALIQANTAEEGLQNFLESHAIFLHLFLPKKVFFKPPLLTQYFADFAILNARDELLLVEIERPHLKMLKKDGGKTADLEHAFHQVRTWKQVLDDHRVAALDAIGLQFREVAKVKGVVVAGRKPSDEKNLRMLRSLSDAEIELFTYDDLLNAVAELIKHVASV